MSEALITQEEAAKRLGVCKRTVRRYVRRGWLVPVQLGRTVRYRPEDVDRLVEAGRKAGLMRVRLVLGLTD